MPARQLILVFAGGLLIPPVAESASNGPIYVTARLYNTAHVPAVVKDAARRVATGALIAAGIHLQWRDCDVADSCTMVPAPGELVIRLVRSPGQLIARRNPIVAPTKPVVAPTNPIVAPTNPIVAPTNPIVAPTLSGRRDETPLVLGQALIDTRARSGTLATIFVDHVELIARLSETDPALLLGRAMAHELGHLLLGTNAHSVRGLMRAAWTPADVRRHASADWALTKEDAAAIRRRLQ